MIIKLKLLNSNVLTERQEYQSPKKYKKVFSKEFINELKTFDNDILEILKNNINDIEYLEHLYINI